MHNRLIRRGPQQQDVLLSTELALSLPILGVVLLAIVEFSLILSAQSAVTRACQRGAEVAAVSGATLDDVRHEVRDSLGARLSYEAQVHLSNAADGDVAVTLPVVAVTPNLLRPVGLDLTGYELESRRSYARD